MSALTVAVTGLHAGENPQPGPGVIRSLRRACHDLTVVGLAYEVLESGVYVDGLTDVVYKIPRPSQGRAALLARWDDILSQQPVDILIPTLDAELPNLIQLAPELARRGVQMLLPDSAAFSARHKSELPDLAKRCDCRVPESRCVFTHEGLLMAAQLHGFPLIVKGPYYGAVCVHNEAELEATFNRLIADWGGPVILQRQLHGGEFDVMAVGDGQGGLSGCCAVRKTLLSEKGKGFGAMAVRDGRLLEICGRIAAELKWRGPIELEFIHDEASEEYYLIEINPRFPAWVDFPSQFGHNLPHLVVEALQNGRVEHLEEFAPGRFFVRHAVDVVGDVRELGEFSVSGETRRAAQRFPPPSFSDEPPAVPTAGVPSTSHLS